MAFFRTLAILITVPLSLLTCLTLAQEQNQISHTAPEIAPSSLPDYTPPSGDVTVGNLEPLQSSSQKEIVTSKTDCGGHGGALGGYAGQGSGYSGSGVPVVPGSWGGQMGGSPGSAGGMIYSGAGSSSSVVGLVAFSSLQVLVATGLMYL